MSRLTLAAGLAAGVFALTALPAQAAFRFEDVTETHLPEMAGRNTMDVEAADLDGDGDLDLVTAQEFRLNIALLNDKGRFRIARDLIPPLPAGALDAGPEQLRFENAGHDSEDVSILDLDRDGRLDVFIVSEDDIKFDRTGVHETYRGTDKGLVVWPGLLPDSEANAIAHADIDGDGDLDILLAGAGQDRLFINDGKGGLTDETDRRLPREAATTQDAEFADLDGDGDLDIVLGQEGGHALWLNDGKGRFTDASTRLPPPGFVEARKVAAVDVDGDRDQDLYFAQVSWQGRQGQDRLLINDGKANFRDETARRIPAENEITTDARFADLDGDGDLDVVRAERGPVTVWFNDGKGVFTDVTAQVIATPIDGSNLALEIQDFDGDGVLDLYVGQLRGPTGGQDQRDRLLLGRRG